MNTKPGDPVFPRLDHDGVARRIGLTKRELFAAMAMQGISANSKNTTDRAHVAAAAVEYADALIAALNEKGGTP